MNYYGQYRYVMSNGFGDDTPIETMNPSLLWRPERIDALRNGGVTGRDIANAMSVISVERKVRSGEGKHIFIDQATALIITNSVRNLTEPEMTSFVPDEAFGIVYVEGEPPCLFMCIGLGDESFMRISLEDYGIFVSHAIKGEDFERDHSRMTENEEDVMCKRSRLMYGMFLMIKEFPELLVDGPPSKIKHPAWYKRLNNKQSVCISAAHASVAPHIRSGHFRLLKAERYTHKRGKLVFVKPTMVNGKAKHTEKGDYNGSN